MKVLSVPILIYLAGSLTMMDIMGQTETVPAGGEDVGVKAGPESDNTLENRDAKLHKLLVDYEKRSYYPVDREGKEHLRIVRGGGDIATQCIRRNDAISALRAFSAAARIYGDPVSYLYLLEEKLIPQLRTFLWKGERPYLTLYDFSVKDGPVVQPLYRRQHRELACENDGNTASNDVGQVVSLGPSRFQGRCTYGVPLTWMTLSPKPFGVHLKLREALPTDAKLVLTVEFPAHGEQFEWFYSARRSAGDDWVLLDTGERALDVRRAIVNDFLGSAPLRNAVLPEASWDEIPIKMVSLGLDIPEGAANTWQFDRVELYLPEESMRTDLITYANDDESVAVGAGSEASGVGTDSDLVAQRIEELNAIGYLGVGGEVPEDTGVTKYDRAFAFKGLNLYTAGHAAAAYLIDMEGIVRHVWQKPFQEVWPDRVLPKKGSVTRPWRRVYLYENGDLLGIYASLGLIKLDKDSNIIWAVEGNFHHDLEVASDGTIYVLSRKAHIVPRLNQHLPVLEDFISVLNPAGEELRRVSLAEALDRSSYASVLHGHDIVGDYLHTNTLEILDGRLAHRSAAFRAGNILISMLYPHFIGVVDMETERIVWGQTGQWLYQHQPTVLDNGNMLIFDNRGPQWQPGALEASRILEFDPFTRELAWKYEGTRNRRFWSRTCGSVQRLPNGNTLISETNRGRAFEVTREGTVVWEFYNPYTIREFPDQVAHIFELVRLEPDFPTGWFQTS